MSRLRATSTYPRTLLVIKGDTNDADYIVESTDITDRTFEFVEKIRRIAAVVKLHQGEWPDHEYSGGKSLAQEYPELTEDELEFFGSYCPHGEHGIHTIESVQIMVVSSVEDIV